MTGTGGATRRTAAPVSFPVALTVAGSDSGGGAGVQADLAAMHARGVFPTSVVTSVTAQHTRGVEHTTLLESDAVRAQYDAVTGDFDVRAAKTGMLGTAEIVRAVTDAVADAAFPVVVDPVMVATAGDRLLDEAGEAAYEELVAEAALVTPNHDEAAVLTGVEPTDEESARAAGDDLLELGADAALVTGGHGADETVRDVLVTPDGAQTFERPRVETDATHGSGCTLSASIAAELARDTDLETAVERGVDAVARAIRYPLDVGSGPGAVNHLAEFRNQAARADTRRAVRGVVDHLVDRDATALVPEVGTNVVGATPYAESVDETAAVEGRVVPVADGLTPTRGVRFGASSHVARFLLAAREHAPALRFAANCRLDADTRDALDGLDEPVAWFDRADEPDDADTMDWAADRVLADADASPAAVADEGAVGKEPMIRLLAETPEALCETLDALRNGGG